MNETMFFPGGEIRLSETEIIIKLNNEASIIDKEDALQEAKFFAALNKKPIRIEE